MNLIDIETGRLGYRDFLDLVIRAGHRERSAPRGLRTLDAGPTCVRLSTPLDALPVGVGRRVSLQVAAAEAVQLIGGYSDPRLLPAQFQRFQEDDGSFHGAYGPRTHGQFQQVIRKLTADPDTRQAVVTIWDPRLDNEPARDIPCTVALFFRLNRDQLKMRVVMRSQDVWLGFPYDVWQFGQLQLTLARALDVEVGEYHHVTMSTHLYESDLEATDAVERGRHYPPDSQWTPAGIGSDGEPWNSIEHRARVLPYANSIIQGMSVSDMWYRKHLADRLRLDRPKDLM